MTGDFINHLMLCMSCNGGVGRYCDEGKLLKIDSDAEYFASSLAKIADRQSREAYMTKFCPKQYFDMPALKAAITEKYKYIKKTEKVGEE